MRNMVSFCEICCSFLLPVNESIAKLLVCFFMLGGF